MWLIEQSTLSQLKEAMAKNIEISADVRAEHAALMSPSGGVNPSRILQVQDNVATIEVHGVISNKPDIFSMLFGGGNVLWGEIQAALAEAQQDTNVDEIVLQIDSGGGSVDGMFDTLAAVQAVDKPIKAKVNNLAASAAFGLASQADEILVNNRAARIGSVGVVARFGIEEDVLSITSTEAPNKAPDVTTDEGKEVVVEELDALHDLFVESIASGRTQATGNEFTPELVNKTFGKGAVFLAEKAQSLGMIDGILGSSVLRSSEISNKITATQSASNLTTGEIMDLKTLKRDHADLYEAAIQDGVTQERDRVVAHLLMGQSAGAIDTAIKAVEDGQEMTQTLTAKYMAAGLNKNEASARSHDEGESANALDNATSEAPQADLGDMVASLVEEQLGVA